MRWRLSAAVYLLMACSAGISAPIVGLVGRPLMFWSTLPIVVGFTIAFALARRGRSAAAACFGILPLNFGLLVSIHLFGAGLFEMGFLVSLCVSFLVLDAQHRGMLLFLVVATLAMTLWATLVRSGPPVIALTPQEANILRAVCILLVGIVVAVILYYFTMARAAASRLQSALESAESARQTQMVFLAKMSHELRTPMNGVLGMLDVLGRTQLSEEQRDHLATARSSGRSLLHILNDILDLSKIEAGELTLQSVRFGLRALIDECARVGAAQLSDKDVDMRVRYADDVPERFVGDPGKLRQVLLNLVGNAVKFTRRGHIVIDVSCRSCEDEWAELVIAVEDTGPGIPRAERAHIFEKFKQVENPLSRSHGGTGLGLAIVRELVEAMGGSVDVESEVGRGSRFHIDLPLPVVANEPEPQRESTDQRMEREVRTFAGLRVLVVDDNPVNQKVAVRILEELGCASDVAEDGASAIHRCEAADEPYDVIFMDMQMPGMDGLEASARIRERMASGEKRTPIVALTAHAMTGDEACFRAAGMDDYLSKPIDREAVVAVLARVLDLDR